MSKGTVYLIPMPIGSNTAEDVMPSAVVQSTIALKFFIVENVKTTRRYLRKLDRTFPIDKSTFFELNKKTTDAAPYVTLTFSLRRCSLHEFLQVSLT